MKINQKTKNALRWVAVPFSAVLACMIVSFLMSFSPVEDGCFKLSLNDFMSGCSFVAAGTIMAPKNREIVSVVLSTFLCTFCLLYFIFFAVTKGFDIQFIVFNIAFASGGILGGYMMFEIDKDSKKDER